MNNVQYSAIEKTAASGEQIALTPMVAVTLLGNRGYYECIDGEPSMVLSFQIVEQEGMADLPIEGAPIAIIQTPGYAAALPMGTVSKAGEGQPVLMTADYGVSDANGKGQAIFVMRGVGTGFVNLLVGNYEHIPFEVVVHPQGWKPAEVAPTKHKSFKNFFAHLV